MQTNNMIASDRPFFDGFTIASSLPEETVDIKKEYNPGCVLSCRRGCEESSVPKQITLDEYLDGGTEGKVFKVKSGGKDIPFAAKMFKKTSLRQKAKIQLLVSRNFKYPGICYPSAWLSEDRESDLCLGVLIPLAPKTDALGSWAVQEADMSKRLIIADKLMSVFNFMNKKKFFTADFNENNFLVSEDGSKLWAIDIDSCQVENFPCPVAAPDKIFEHPLMIKEAFCNYTSYLRAPYEFAYGVCVMLFSVIFQKKPYLVQAQEPCIRKFAPENIFAGEFLFRSENSRNSLWKSCPEGIRKMFESIFSKEGYFFENPKELVFEDLLKFYKWRL